MTETQWRELVAAIVAELLGRQAGRDRGLASFRHDWRQQHRPVRLGHEGRAALADF